MARTLITNTSGGEKHFGFLPPHGVTLEDAEEHVVDGDLRTILAGGRGRYSRSREITALDAAGQAEVWDIVHLGANIPVGVGSKARDRFVALFGGGSDTITALQATLTENISRGVELGLGVIAEGHVTKARFTG